jgi:glycosyltransferase involved in cell wall biosynthesis
VRLLFSVDPEIPVPPRLYGGIERIVDALVVELRSRGHAVGLVAHPDSECATDFFRGWPGRASNDLVDSLRNTFALLGAVRAFKPDLLHSFSRLGYMLPLLTRQLPKIMSYQRHTGGPRNRIAATLGRSSFAFTACSEFIAKQGRQWGGQWFVIPNFVDTRRYSFVSSVPADAPLVFLSRVERIKGAHSAIEIARRAGRRLMIAGNRVSDGEGPGYWDNEIAPHVGRNGIQYVGPVNDKEKNDLLGSAAALLVPIEWDEPFGIVFVEALACGTPVISCPRGALPEIVKHGSIGFLIEEMDAGVAAVEKLSTISRHACRERAERHFSSTVVTTQYEQLYRSLINRR